MVYFLWHSINTDIVVLNTSQSTMIYAVYRNKHFSEELVLCKMAVRYYFTVAVEEFFSLDLKA